MKVNKSFSLDIDVIAYLNKKDNTSEFLNTLLRSCAEKERSGFSGAVRCKVCNKIFPDKLVECPHCKADAAKREADSILKAKVEVDEKNNCPICNIPFERTDMGFKICPNWKNHPQFGEQGVIDLKEKFEKKEVEKDGRTEDL